MWGRTQKDGTQPHNNSEAGQLSAGIPLKADMSLAMEPLEFGSQLSTELWNENISMLFLKK